VQVPPLEERGPTGAGTAPHTDRCWLPLEAKVALREFRPGEIGLGAKTATPVAAAEKGAA
jgi:hypothetical protein